MLVSCPYRWEPDNQRSNPRISSVTGQGSPHSTETPQVLPIWVATQCACCGLPHSPNSPCKLPVCSPSIYPCVYNWDNFHHIPSYQHLLHHWNILKLKTLGKEEHCFLLFSKNDSSILPLQCSSLNNKLLWNNPPFMNHIGNLWTNMKDKNLVI